MKNLIIILLLLPVGVFAQSQKPFTITSKADSSWINLDSGWRFIVGDNMEWANPDFDDSSWQTIKQFGNSFLENNSQIPKGPGIIWFRLWLTADSTLNKQLVLRINQSGASEIYLDGKIIQKLGTVSSNPDSTEYYNTGLDLLSLPLLQNKEHLLAIRFANMPIHFPLYSLFRKSFFTIDVSTLDYLPGDPSKLNEDKFFKRTYFAAGVGTILFILFLSFYIFFPSQKMNLYFSLSILFFTLSLITETGRQNIHEYTFRLSFLYSVFVDVSTLSIFTIIYKVLNQKFGWVYWVILISGILAIPLLFVFNYFMVVQFLGIFILVEIIRICIKSLKATNEAWIILIGISLPLIFWIYNFLSYLDFIKLPTISAYSPIAQIIPYVSLAVYLGFTFGQTSQSLRKKLKEVEKLSSEKQQILSTQNQTLEMQVKERTSELNQSLEHLKSTQSQLIQSEKMASLGELTAGIAHEIQNPLNFVNNFSEINNELIDELNEEVDKGNVEEVKAIAKDIKNNGQKINHHGKRADAIVKGMLQHSRTTSGVKEPIDINALADEYLRLAYHGFKAKDKSFNADFKLEADKNLPLINVILQDIGRVLLNLINNAFYAVDQKARNSTPQPPEGGAKNAETNYKPRVTVVTTSSKSPSGDLGVKISVKDNGDGINKNIVDKIFQPFFTTKPTGQGTGLGLSLSYDIVKAHGGELTVESKEGEGSEFIIHLPINLNA